MTRKPAKDNYLFFHYLDYFSSRLEAPILDNAIKIPSHIGKGYIKWYILEEGFGLRFYNFTLHSDTEFDLFTEEESGTVYKIIYELDKEHSRLEEVLKDKDKEAYLYFSEFQKKFKFRRGEHVCRLVLIFNSEWLQNNHPNAKGKIEQLLATLTQNNQSATMHVELGRKSSYIIRQLAEIMDHASSPPIVLKTNLFILINTFFDKIISRSKIELQTSESLAYHSPHFNEIIEIAENLEKYINNPFSALPNIESLAHEYHMSESTLRRHFKIVCGKNIYEYYQGKRMYWARRELQKGEVTITELARKLGFRKPNNFSKAFRKEFHMLPNELKHGLTLIFYMYLII